ncbi:MAG: hypothetical protein ACLU7P_09280 [Eggerthella lenta]
MTEPLKIGVLLSGSGTNLQAIIDAAAEGLPVEIVHGVVAPCVGIERAGRHPCARCSTATCTPTRRSR